MKKLVCLLVSLGFLGMTGAWSNLEAQTLKFATTVRTHPILTLPVMAAVEKGFFKSNGVDAEWTNFRGDGPAMQAVAAKALNMGLGGAAGNILASSQGVPVVIVADMQVSDYGFRIWVHPDSKIKRAADLKGATIAINRYGGLAHAYGRMAVKQYGLEGQVKFASLGSVPSAIAGFKAKKVDGVVLTLFAMDRLRHDGLARPVISMVDVLPKKWSEIVIFARVGFVKEDPRVVRGAVKSVLEGANYVLDNPAWTMGKLRSHFRFPEDDVEMLAKRINYGRGGKIDPEAIKNVRDILVKYGIIKGKPASLDALYTNRFVQ